jgi:hypothetical protein
LPVSIASIKRAETGKAVLYRTARHLASIFRVEPETMDKRQQHRFIGPWVLGTLALFTRDAAVRKKALLQGAAYLTRDCLAHNAYRFFVSAAEVALLEGDLVAADFYAGQLEGYAASEHHAALVRAYAGWSSAPDNALRAELRRLHADAERFGFSQATPLLFEKINTL